MALFTEERLRNRVRNELIKSVSRNETFETKAKTILNESVKQQRLFSETAKTYDIFLSHSSGDVGLVAGLKLEIEDLGYTVYVDWIEDPQLNRANVSRETALLLQKRMRQCNTLIYAFSENASGSKWMPWELGYFDGIKGTVAVLPISKTTKSNFQGSEYLGIYFYIQIDTAQGTNEYDLWVHETSTKYIKYTGWVGGTKPIQR